MASQAIAYPEHRGHLLGDVPALFLVAVVLGLLMPRQRVADRSLTGASTPVRS